ncbi:MAG: hypothetical protein KKC51_07980 [Verrucomicrobia bacterium]|nr:hypothetical protein [Verrucomicrobiota bacterium]
MKRALGVVVLFIVMLFVAGCAAGDARFEAAPAGFWAGLWHGLICIVTFIISLFNDSVRVYEVHNAGHLYDLGFILGAAIAFGGCGGSGACRSRKSSKEKEWDEIGVRVEEKVRKGIRSWLDESGKKDAEWEEIGAKIEEKVKRELRNWSEK